MGIKDNFTQAMKELTNPRPSDSRKEVKDVASYMNDSADVQSADPAQNVQPSQNVQTEQQYQNVNTNTAGNGFSQQNPGQDFSQRIARDMNEQYNQNNSFAQNTQNAQNNGFAQNTQNVQNNSFAQNTQNVQNNGFAQNTQSAQNNSFTQSAQNNTDNGFNQNMQNNNPNNSFDNGGSNPFLSGLRADGEQEMTVISKNTMIDGNVRSFADMKIDGNIKGNVETTKNININGKVVGDLTCDNISMRSSAIQGNVRLKGQALMANDSMLIGDLTSQVAQLNGKIKGNIEISGKIQLDRDSVIIGDIKAGSIAISDGAVINGFVTTTYLSKDESANIFPESIALGE